MALNNQFREKYGPWAVVAGASEGLGAEFASQLAAKGLNLLLVARRAALLAELAARLAQEHSIQARALPLDLASPQAPGEIASAAGDLEAGLLVYNAAFSTIGPFLETSLDDHLRELDVNTRAPLALIYHFGRRFIERGGGGMILLSSLSATQGSAYISNYAATKAYNLILAEGLWEELRTAGVDVLASCPGSTSTPGYLSSLAERPQSSPAPVMPPGPVVAETLAALGKRSSLIPGRLNRLMGFAMNRLLPRNTAIRIMGRVLRDMYVR